MFSICDSSYALAVWQVDWRWWQYGQYCGSGETPEILSWSRRYRMIFLRGTQREHSGRTEKPSPPSIPMSPACSSSNCPSAGSRLRTSRNRPHEADGADIVWWPWRLKQEYFMSRSSPIWGRGVMSARVEVPHLLMVSIRLRPPVGWSANHPRISVHCSARKSRSSSAASTSCALGPLYGGTQETSPQINQ